MNENQVKNIKEEEYKFNVIIKDLSGKKVGLQIYPDIIVSEMFEEYLNKINIPSEFINKKKDLTFIYNGGTLRFYDKRKIQQLFIDRNVYDSNCPPLIVANFYVENLQK